MSPSLFIKPAASAKRGVGKFRRDRRGSAAVEFALVAPIFFALLFAILETGFVFFAGQTLETVTQDVGRMVMTGRAQNAGYTQVQFKNEVCSRLTALFDCQNGIYVDVQSFPSFASVTIPDAIDSSRHFIPTMQYQPGTACDVVVMRLFYQWPLFVTGLGYDMSNLAGSKRLLIATAAFRNEPYGTASCT